MSDFATLLKLYESNLDIFVSMAPGGASGRVFGGQLLAQAMLAGLSSIEAGKPAHAFHAHFLHAGDGAEAIDFAIERLRDGRSFSTREITARQGGRALLKATLSAHAVEDGLAHQVAMPDVSGPEGLRTEAEIREEAMLREDVAWQGPVLMPGILAELRPVTPRDVAAPKVMAPMQHFWIRPTGPVPADVRLRQSILAYLSDIMLLSTALLPHGVYWSTTSMDSVSLNHALWIHAVPDFDDWLLWSADTSWSGGARGLATGRFFTRQGRLVASVAQEGLIRVHEERR